jgi:hypothetical protein
MYDCLSIWKPDVAHVLHPPLPARGIELHLQGQRAHSSGAPTKDYLSMVGIPVRLPASRLNWKQKKPHAMWLALLGGQKLSAGGL